jgi:glyoxalase family protein
MLVNGLHHVTATVADAQQDLDFYTKLLGMRLIKRTVNFDNSGVYHFYYGDGQGSPGTIMTTFPYKGKGVHAGVKGAGQVSLTTFSVPTGSLDFWRDRLARHGVSVSERGRRFGEEVITFGDPSGLILEFVGCNDNRGDTWAADDIGTENAIRGIHSVTLVIQHPNSTLELLQEILGFEVLAEHDNRKRLGVRGGGAGRVLDVLHIQDVSAGVNGMGTVHHVALAVAGDDEQRTIQEELRRLGHNVTDVRDRNYFRSIYFREPGGVLLEVATEGPGFLVDEPREALGRKLMLPEWEESRRAEIEAALPDIHA